MLSLWGSVCRIFEEKNELNPFWNKAVTRCADPLRSKVALNTPLRRAASSTVVCTFCAYARCNKPVALVLKTLD